MGNEVHAFGARLNRAATALSGAPMREVMTHLGVAAKKDLERAVSRDAGGDLAMRNWPKAKMTSGFEHTGEGRITVKARPAGPWRVLSEGARPHTVTAKGARGGRRGRGGARLLRTPYGPRPYVHIPHTRGHGTWARGVQTVKTETPDRISTEMRTLLGKVMG